MHDGLLQDIAAANLLLTASARSLPVDSRGALAEVRKILVQQQQRVRAIVESANPKPDPARQKLLAEQISEVSSTLGRQWQCTVSATVEPEDFRASNELVSHVRLILSEATANAVRHGKANHVRVAIAAKGGKLHLELADDGQRTTGGASTPAFLPFSLNQRIGDLGGRLAVRQGTTGIVLCVELPIR